MNTFWEERFCEESRIWGDTPSRTALYAIKLFKKAGVREVLIPGSGYGRNAEAFARAGFEVTGIEISDTALTLAHQSSLKVRYHQGSVLDMPFDDSMYDGIYCFNVLHLFRKNDRAAFLQRCREQLKEGGVMFFVVFSDREPSYGTGRMVEENTFESKPGREVCYYSVEDLVSEFLGLEILKTGMIEDLEEHGSLTITHELLVDSIKKENWSKSLSLECWDATGELSPVVANGLFDEFFYTGEGRGRYHHLPDTGHVLTIIVPD